MGCGYKLLFYMENASTTLEPGLTIYNQKKVEVWRNHENTKGSDMEATLDCKPGEKYFVQVWGDDGTAGKYRLTVKQQ